MTDKFPFIPSPTELLRKYGLAPRKSWGQNFLHDPYVHAKIVEEARRSCDTQKYPRVLEIGVGLGTLTMHMLAAGLEVWGIERDRDLCEALRREMPAYGPFKLHEEDAVKFDYASGKGPLGERPTVVGNLPYQLTGPLLFRLLNFHADTGAWIVMVQKEVGQRLAADPGNKTYGGITVALGRVRKMSWVCDVGPGAFIPPPRVDSAVLRLEPREKALVELDDEKGYLELVRTAFQQRRKTLLNTLSRLASKEDVLRWCKNLNIDPGLRPEALSVEQFGQLQRQRELEARRE